MIPQFREQFNHEFSEEKYLQLQKLIARKTGFPADFRLSESPVFLPASFKLKLDEACNSIISQIKAIPKDKLETAIPAQSRVPGDSRQHPHFLIIDFAISQDSEGEAEPQLIELQAFPSLFAFQKEFEEDVKDLYPFIEQFSSLKPKQVYIDLLKKVILGDENAENVVLLEIFPEKQKTKIDFAYTEKYLGIKTVCLTQVKKQGNKLFYESDGRLIPINRIYNRVIFDELDRIPNLRTEFDFRENIDVEWVTHPDWFFMISKFILPKLQHQFIPKSYFLSDFPADEEPENFVMKPLFSFAGSGVNLHPTRTQLAEISDPENYIMQRKVAYKPLFKDINGDFAKAEIRMMYLWEEGSESPELVQNIVRMTKAAMVNVDFNKKDAIWIGSSIAFFEDQN